MEVKFMNDRTLFGILTILFNNIGIPCFLQGDVKSGIIRIVIFVIPLVNLISIVNFVFGILLGIEILKMTDEEFAAKKGTFVKGWPV